MEQSVLEGILAWINKESGMSDPVRGGVQEDSRLLEENFLDSLRLLKLVSHLEETYRIEIGVENMLPTNFATPAEIAGLVLKLTSNSDRPTT